jgi:fibro-slime domain-containing protein
MRRAWLVLGGIVALVACGDSDGDAGGDGGDGGAGGDTGRGDGGPGGGTIDGGGLPCGVLAVQYRDFRAEHPDFEDAVATDRGLVEVDLGADRKPVYAPAGATVSVSGQASFDEWYRDVQGVNQRFDRTLTLSETSPGVFAFSDDEFFPLDGVGWGEEINGHNFHFTTEIHTGFRYRGGEVFTFTGDDDVFVFVNGKLALDLGGVHGPQTTTIDFDGQAAGLGIAPGNLYTLDAFHAERHTSMSNFRIETSIDCFVVP